MSNTDLNVETTLCAFGCGRIAVHVLKNGKAICARSANQCPVMRERNGADKRGKDPFAGRQHPRGMAGKPAWNRGRRYDQLYDVATAERIREAAGRAGKKGRGERLIAPDVEADRRRKLAAHARRRGLGGYQRGSGRGNKGWYRGHWCDSTYELAFVVWALDHDIPFERNFESFPYEFDGRLMRWLPDFRLADGTYLEIKGYVSAQSLAKFDFFYRPLRVFSRADLQEMFTYVETQYGRGLAALYE